MRPRALSPASEGCVPSAECRRGHFLCHSEYSRASACRLEHGNATRVPTHIFTYQTHGCFLCKIQQLAMRRGGSAMRGSWAGSRTPLLATRAAPRAAISAVLLCPPGRPPRALLHTHSSQGWRESGPRGAHTTGLCAAPQGICFGVMSSFTPHYLSGSPGKT